MEFVSIDIETANSKRNSMCSIGLVKFKDGLIVDALYTLINPEDSFDSFNTSIHGITQEMVIEEPTFEEFAPIIVKFIDNLPFVAHFAAFDAYALKDAFLKYNLPIPPLKYFCSYQISKFSYTLPSYRLNAMADYFNIDNLNHHNALSDAKTAGQIVNRILKDKNKTLEELLNDLRYTFGILNNKGFIRKDLPHNSLKHYDLKIDTSLHDKSHVFYEKNLCFTGSLQRFTRREIAQKVTDIGATFQTGVNKKTNYLVVGDLENLEKSTGKQKSSKIIKAEKLSAENQEIEIISEIDFYKLFDNTI